MKSIRFKTTWGVITLTLKNGKAVALDLPPLKTAPRRPFAIEGFQTLEQFIKKVVTPCGRCPAENTAGPLSLRSGPPIGTPDGTDFQRAVWNELKNIPRGQTRTYGEIAAAIGRPKAVRAVGSACGANPLPLFIPCHRIVAKNGLGGFGSGLPWKKLLLELEGWSKGTGMME